jgi:hypothetical protein
VIMMAANGLRKKTMRITITRNINQYLPIVFNVITNFPGI